MTLRRTASECAPGIKIVELPKTPVTTIEGLRGLIHDAVKPQLGLGTVVTLPRGSVDQSAMLLGEELFAGRGLLQATLHTHSSVHLLPVGPRNIGTVITTYGAAAKSLHACLEDAAFRGTVAEALSLPSEDTPGWTLEKVRTAARVGALRQLPEASSLPPWLQGYQDTAGIAANAWSGFKALLLGTCVVDNKAAYQVLREVQTGLGAGTAFLDWNTIDFAAIAANELHARDVRFGDRRGEDSNLALVPPFPASQKGPEGPG